MSMSNPTSLPSSNTAMWRSKLGTNYDKEFMEQNEDKLIKQVQALRELPENHICADCGARGTVWASVNLGVFLCMTCGSHHRALGTHISLPKGCTGSYWWGPDEIAHMKSHGNARAKQVYGDGIPNGVSKDDATLWRQYLTNKYVHKKFAPSGSSRHQTTSTPPLSPQFSPKSKTRVVSPRFSPKMVTVPDLAHFESSSSTASPKAAVQNGPGKKLAFSAKPATGDDFFAQFGV